MSKYIAKSEKLILETDDTTTELLLSKEKLIIGWVICPVSRYVNVLKRQSFGHHIDSCTASIVCSICAGPHNNKDCMTPEDFKCINCIKFNENSEEQLDINHPVFTMKCPILKSKFKQKSKRVNPE